MDWFQHERYENGHYGGDTLEDFYVPDWASVLGWEGVGCWVIVEHADLMKAIPGLEIMSSVVGVAAASLGFPPSSASGLMDYFSGLEDRGINLIGLSEKQEIICRGCTLRRTPDGDIHFVGLMEVRTPVKDIDTNSVKYISTTLPSRLTILTIAGDVTLPFGQTSLPGFVVPCKVTMKASDLNQKPKEKQASPPRVTSRSHVFFRSSTASSGHTSQSHLLATRPPSSSPLTFSWFTQPSRSKTSKR